MSTSKDSKAIEYPRRRFLGTAAMSIAGAQLGTFASANAQSNTASPANVTTTLKPSPETHTAFASLKQINAGLLD
ncbi:MAG: alpha/beta hydrolase, partial [Vulcanimicrobiaceae bacterium]